MKALTLREPLASLLTCGEKQYETRSWKTDYRGPLAIHASLYDSDLDVVDMNSFYWDAFRRNGYTALTKLPFGKVLCVADLVDVVQIKEVDRGVVFGSMLTEKEEAFGDYSHGRYAWKFEHLQVLSCPIPARGYQGIWEWAVQMEQLKFRK